MSWSDGHQSLHPVRSSRLAFNCTSRVHQFTRAPLFDPANVPGNVRPTGIGSVGRHGIRIVWSDGHHAGIASFRDLRASGPCDECSSDAAEKEAVVF
jgi:ATP-binding protein involved in chromosome partitioning